MLIANTLTVFVELDSVMLCEWRPSWGNNALRTMSPDTNDISANPAVNVGKADIPLERLETAPNLPCPDANGSLGIGILPF